VNVLNIGGTCSGEEENISPRSLQVGGHLGCVKAGSLPGRIVKKTNRMEVEAYRAWESLPEDTCISYVPKFFGLPSELQGKACDGGSDEFSLELENLVPNENACVMDCKIGGRTFLESEVLNTKLRPDLASKLESSFPGTLSKEELESGITKQHYMQCRDQHSSISTMQFRIEGYTTRYMGDQHNVQADKLLCQRLQTRAEVLHHLQAYLQGAPPGTANKMLSELEEIAAAVASSTFFEHYEVIGSSLLLIYDPEGSYAKVAIIDFGKTVLRSEHMQHNVKWELGNHEDEFLSGLYNLISLWKEA